MLAHLFVNMFEENRKNIKEKNSDENGSAKTIIDFMLIEIHVGCFINN